MKKKKIIKFYKCISTIGAWDVQTGKLYEGVKRSNEIVVLNDRGLLSSYPASCFEETGK
jgi:hypothetical protein